MVKFNGSRLKRVREDEVMRNGNVVIIVRRDFRD
jgi:hypothetical protein